MHWRKNSRWRTNFRNTPCAETNERTNEFGTRSPHQPSRGGVSFSVASDHRDRDRCDQPPRSRCRGQHHYTVAWLSFSLSPPVEHPPSAHCPPLTQTRSPDVSIARLRASSRRWITRRRECYWGVINPRARKENEFNDPEMCLLSYAFSFKVTEKDNLCKSKRNCLISLFQ